MHFQIHPLVFENISKSLKILELSFSIYSEDYPQEAISYLSESYCISEGFNYNTVWLLPSRFSWSYVARPGQ